MSKELSTTQPLDLFHGTLKPVHLMKPPFLDPNKSCGGDIGDPVRPHVFLTPNKLFATLFAFKSPELIISGIFVPTDASPIPYQIYSELPKNLGPGYVYKISAADYPDIHEIIVNGRPTQKYVTYSPVDVSAGPEQILAGGLPELMDNYKAQIFVIRSLGLIDKFSAAWEESRGSATPAFLDLMSAWRKSGDVRHLNEEQGIHPYPVSSWVPD